MFSAKTKAVVISLGASFALVACGQAEEAANDAKEKVTDAGASAAVEASSESKEAAEKVTGTGEPKSANPESVFAALEAVKAQNESGVITSVDRKDNSDDFDIEVVIGQDRVQFDVPAGEDPVEKVRDNDEDVEKAQAVKVDAAEAIKKAQEEHPDSILDEAELERENGALVWEISLDDKDFNDLADVSIPAQ